MWCSVVVIFFCNEKIVCMFTLQAKIVLKKWLFTIIIQKRPPVFNTQHINRYVDHRQHFCFVAFRHLLRVLSTFFFCCLRQLKTTMYRNIANKQHIEATAYTMAWLTYWFVYVRCDTHKHFFL